MATVALVTLADAKAHLHIPDVLHDAEVQQKLDASTDAVLNYLKAQADPTWTAATVPERIRAAILLHVGYLYEDRGDGLRGDGSRGTTSHAEAAWKAIELLLMRDRDPAVA